MKSIKVGDNYYAEEFENRVKVIREYIVTKLGNKFVYIKSVRYAYDRELKCEIYNDNTLKQVVTGKYSSNYYFYTEEKLELINKADYISKEISSLYTFRNNHFDENFESNLSDMISRIKKLAEEI
jgi:hypothetical protein